MNFRIPLINILLIAITISVNAREWQQDILGDGFELTYINHGNDYSGPIRSTVIKNKNPECDNGLKRGILYVHGYNDYFFQKEMAEQFMDSCWTFYATDLRKYGRSILPGNKKFQVRDIKEYFADIDSALSVMREDGIEEVILMGHSTGGLTTSVYMSEKPDTIIKGLILNSPFLEWNMGSAMRKLVIPTISTLSYLIPRMSFSQGDNTAYGESLLKDHHGEWEYNTNWKLLHSQKVEASWIRAIDNAHSIIQDGANIKIPILLMHSDSSVNSSEWTEAYQHADGVLNVEDISRIGRKLGPQVREATIKGGLHDLMLSEPEIRNNVYQTIFKWIEDKGLNQS